MPHSVNQIDTGTLALSLTHLLPFPVCPLLLSYRSLAQFQLVLPFAFLPQSFPVRVSIANAESFWKASCYAIVLSTRKLSFFSPILSFPIPLYLALRYVYTVAMGWLTAIIAIPVIGLVYLIVSTSLALLKNYSMARSIGVPIRVIPISPLNPFWVLVDRHVLSLIRHLPFSNNSFTRYDWRGWELKDRYASHHEMGDFWVLVTPFKNWIYISNPNTLMSIFRQNVEFPRPVFVNEILDVFGPNISSAEGESWKIQRRIATRCFNEQNNEVVWTETIGIAHDMLRYWSGIPSIVTVADDLRTLSLHVLSRAAFGQSFKFEPHDKTASPSANYKSSLQYILENCVLILAFGTKFISYPWLPQRFRLVHEAWVTFRAYMTEVYEKEKKALLNDETSDPNLLTMLIRESQKESGALTENEVYGNMYAFSFAGHDTTANTFTFAVYFLSAHPDVQDWLSEEIQVVFGDRDPSTWDYHADFPRLRRCLSVMYETVRLYTPVGGTKWTADKSQQISINGNTYVLPPGSMISTPWGAIQTDPKKWGDASLEWRPSRWIKDDGGKPGSEKIDYGVRGAFLGWSEGIRDCPGKKFSQVEFTAAMAILFRKTRVSPVPKDGETDAMAQARVMDLIENDSGSVLLLQLLHPERAPLRWTKSDKVYKVL
ncbi:cytochrome P450 [Xylariaceae sp. FL0255]|nr:cytochrome P450 [Xylariaceae sp. FL0255]